MAIVLEGFKVVTEFVFNADTALIGMESLNKQVDKLSRGASDAIDTVARLGVSYALSFSGGTGGVLGILANAIKSSDKFRATQIELASVMVANGSIINGATGSFNDALIQSSLIMDQLVAKARKFGISPDALLSQTKSFNAFLAPKGLQGRNLSQASELARVSLKAAPALGVSNFQAQSGIQSGIAGDLSSNTQFGRRLFLESGKEIEAATGIKSLKEFNKAIPTKRIKALIVGLDKLAGSTEAITARADTLGSRFQQISDLFAGMGSILRPLGDVIIEPIKEILDIGIKFLRVEGAEIVKQMAIFVKGFIKGPKEMLIDLMQLASLSKDLGTAITIGGIALGLAHLKELFGFFRSSTLLRPLANATLGITKFIDKIPFLGKGFFKLQNSFRGMFGLVLNKGFLKGLFSIGKAFFNMAGFVGVLLIPLQGLSNAIARIKVESAANFVKIIPEIMEGINSLVISFKMFMAPINDLIGGWSDFFFVLLGGSSDFKFLLGLFKDFVSLISDMATAFLALWGTFKAIIAGINAMLGTVVGSLQEGRLPSFAEVTGNMAEAFTNEFDKNLSRFTTPTLGEDGTPNVTANNIFNVTMNNSFKEVLQPDRIAFTIQSQLEKASRSRTSSSPTNLTGRAQAGI